MKITDVKAYPVWAGQRNLFVLKIETGGHDGDIAPANVAEIFSFKKKARPRNLWVKGPGFSDGYWGG